MTQPQRLDSAIAGIRTDSEMSFEEQQEAWVNEVEERVLREASMMQMRFPPIGQPTVYTRHANLLITIANKICLAGQNRTFVVDDYNRDILRFLLYYFNNCPLCEQVFPNKRYKRHKNLLIMGDAGSGKTLLMQIFSEYLRFTNNPNAFQNLSVTQMINYYSLNNNLDRYTYNESATKGGGAHPFNICLNDIGLHTRDFFGQDIKLVIDEFLHARNEIWTLSGRDRRCFAHLTTNLDKKQLLEEFKDEHNRLNDRFKTYNIIHLPGPSRR